MALQQKLALRQGQSLQLTPQLTQSIRLLTLSNLELDAYVDDQIEQNPLLVRAEPEKPDPGPAEAAAEPGELTLDGSMATSVTAIERDLGTSVENAFPDARRDTAPEAVGSRLASGAGTGSGSSGDDVAMIERLERAPTMVDVLQDALATRSMPVRTLAVARALVGFLDEAGYLREGDGELAVSLGVGAGLVAQARQALQTCAAPGIGARDLRECLSLQLAARDRLDPAMAALIGRLDLLARRDFATLERVTGLDRADLLDALDEVRALDPCPGHAFDTHASTVPPPDVIVREGPDGGWIVELNDETVPRVLVDRDYITTVGKAGCASANAFLGERLQDATWLLRALDQRNRTLLKVTREIVRRQDAFLLHGVSALEPATLRQVADAIGMHESTVSRVTTGKTVLTPRGTFDMKFFFSTALPGREGADAHSAEAVRHRIRAMIEAEEAGAVLSDDAIVGALRAVGIDIARRTVAKYRESMHIASSVQRRREKRARQAA